MLKVLPIGVPPDVRIPDVEQIENGGIPDAIIVGPGVEAPIQEAQALQRQHHAEGVLFLVPEGEVDTLQRAVMVSPMLGGHARVVDIGDVVQIRAEIRNVERRLRNKAMSKFAQASLGHEASTGSTQNILLDRLMDRAPVGIAVIDEHGVVVGWNRAATKITGRGEKAALGQPAKSALGVDRLSGVQTAKRAGGEAIHVEITGTSAGPDERDGELLVFQDVTARVQAQQELDETLAELESRVEERTADLKQEVETRRAAEAEAVRRQEEYRLLVDVAQDLIWSTDADGVITFASDRAAQAMYGVPGADLVGRKFTSLALPEYQEADQAMLERVVRDEVVYGYETAHQGRDDPVWISFNASVSDDGIIGTGRDVTAMREAAEQRERAERERQELEDLQEMEAFRTSFINSAAHELRTPLTPLAVQVRLLEHNLRDAGPPVKDSLASLRRNMERFQRLIGDLLEAARYQGGKLSIDAVPLDAAALAADAATEYAGAAADKDIELKIDVTRPLRVHGDPDRLQQIIQNLLNNAFRFTPEGGRISIRGRQRQEHILIEVEDTGAGMTQEQLDSLFQPFTQFHEDGGGTGLGLYLSEGIARLHHGTLTATSPGPGQGTTFTLQLPRRIG